MSDMGILDRLAKRFYSYDQLPRLMELTKQEMEAYWDWLNDSVSDDYKDNGFFTIDDHEAITYRGCPLICQSQPCLHKLFKFRHRGARQTLGDKCEAIMKNTINGYNALNFGEIHFVVRSPETKKDLSKRDDIILVTRKQWNDIELRLIRIYNKYVDGKRTKSHTSPKRPSLKS